MKASRRTIGLILAGVVVVAGALAATLILVSRGGGGESTATTVPTRTTATRPAILRGIPQSGITLGNPKAPALIEYADPQCPYCKDAAIALVPDVIDRYVRTGQMKLVWHGVAFIGPDSVKALRAIDAAAAQNRLWDVVERLYEHQGEENSGWVTDEVLDQVGSGIAGLDVEKWKADWEAPETEKLMSDAQQAMAAAGVQSTPTFIFRGQPLNLQSFDIADFSALVDPMLGQ